MIANPKVMIGASIPRSGHHFLQNLMTKFFGPDLYYCEFYSPKECCKTIPCLRRGAFPYVFQKSHDRDMEVPTTLSDAVYILQYRRPVSEALSDRELDTVDGIGRLSLAWRLSREHYLTWLANKAVYYRRYHDKWMVDRVPNGIYLDYDVFSRAPADGLERIVRAATGSADRGRIDAVVAEAAAVRVSTSTKGTESFKRRVDEDSPHWDPELLGAFEDYVTERTPQFGWPKKLSGRYRGHPIHGLILAMDEQEPLPAGATDRMQAAIALAGEHPELMIRLAQRETRAGDPAGAAARLRRVVEQYPHCTHAWKPLLAAYRVQKVAPPAELFSGNALIGMAGRPETLVEAGKALLDAGHLVTALAALTLSVTFAPGNARAHHHLAQAMLKAGKPNQALSHAEQAAEMDPANSASGQLLANVRRRLDVQRAA